MSAEDAVRALARFVARTRFQDLAPAVVARTRWHVLDTLGAALAGRDAPGVVEVRGLAQRWRGAAESLVWGTDLRVPAPTAALVNGTMARALELDSIHEVGLLHAAVSAVPAALAAAEARVGVSGREMLVAALVGSDVICRMGLAPTVGSCVSGMSFTYQCGTFGAAAAAARALGLDEDATAAALGLAYNMASGNQQPLTEGSQSVRVQQGVATQMGVMAAEMAAAGLVGPREALEGTFGYFRVYHGGRYDRQALLKDLGVQFELMNMSFKPWPCCRFIHPAIDAALEILGRRSLAEAEVHAVEVRVDNLNHYNVVCEPLAEKQVPRTPAEAQFALPFVIATVLLRGHLTLADLTPGALADPAVRRLARRVTTAIAPEARRGDGRAGYPPGRVEVRLASGEVLRAEIAVTRGHPDRPLGDADLTAKFRDCASAGARPYGRAAQDRIIEAVLEIERAADVREITALLTVPTEEG